MEGGRKAEGLSGVASREPRAVAVAHWVVSGCIAGSCETIVGRTRARGKTGVVIRKTTATGAPMGAEKRVLPAVVAPWAGRCMRLIMAPHGRGPASGPASLVLPLWAALDTGVRRSRGGDWLVRLFVRVWLPRTARGAVAQGGGDWLVWLCIRIRQARTARGAAAQTAHSEPSAFRVASLAFWVRRLRYAGLRAGFRGPAAHAASIITGARDYMISVTAPGRNQTAA